jgi:arylsulfatase A-like enzyme
MKTLLTALTAALLFAASSHAAEPRRPNILFILTDDQSPFDFKFHNPQSTLQSPNWLPAHPFDNTHSDVRDEKAVSGVWDRRDEATIRNEIGRDYACSEIIDIQIGRVLARLEEMGELENTYIFYTADHGIAIGRHGLQGKQNLYEHTWRVPMIVKGPGIKPGLPPHSDPRIACHSLRHGVDHYFMIESATPARSISR